MPIAKIRLPDGRIAKFEVPEGTTEEQVMAFVKEQGIGQEAPPQAAQPAAPATEEPGLAERAGTAMKQAAGSAAFGAVNVAGGLGNFVTELAQTVYDAVGAGAEMVGAQGVADYAEAQGAALEERQRRIAEASNFIAGDFYRKVTGEEVADQEAADKLGGYVREAADISAKIGAGIATGGRVGASTFKGQVAVQGLEGAVVAGALSEAEGDTREARNAKRLGDMKVGAAFGVGTGALTGAYTTGRNFIARQVQKYNADPGTNRAFDIAEEFDMPITFGQASGNPYIQHLETQAQEKLGQEFYARQAGIASQRIAARLGLPVRTFEEAGNGTALAMRNVEDAVRVRVSQLKAARNAEWKQSINQAVAVSNDMPLYRPMDFRTELQNVMQDMADSFGGKLKPSPELMKMVDEVETATRVGGAKARDLNRWWQTVNDWKASRFGVIDDNLPGAAQGMYSGHQQVWAGRLSRRLSDSIENASAAQAGTPASQALDMLKGARTRYHGASQDIRTIEDDFLTALGLGKENPQTVLNRLLTMDPAVARVVTNHVGRLEGGQMYLHQLRSAVHDGAVMRASQATGGKAGQTGGLDIAAYRKALMQTADRSVFAGIAQPGFESTAREGLDLLGSILNAAPQRMPGGVLRNQIPMALSDLAINAVSQNSGFIARLVANNLSRGKGFEWLMFSPEGVRMLRNMHPEVVKSGVLSPARNAAVALMANQIGQSAKEEVDMDLIRQMSQRSAAQ